MITIRNSADIAVNGVKMLIYGAAGVGKTPTAATAPLPLILSAENGLLSIRHMKIPYIEIRSYKDLMEAFQFCMTSQEMKNFYTICLDSVSEIAEVCLTDAKKKAKDPRQAYGVVIDDVINLCRAFRDLPRCVVLIAKEEYEKDEATGAMLFRPMMPGSKLGPKLPYYFDEVFRLEINPANRAQKALHTASSFQHVARDRSGMLAEFEPCDLTHVVRKILQV